jgi:hypothetical protein
MAGVDRVRTIYETIAALSLRVGYAHKVLLVRNLVPRLTHRRMRLLPAFAWFALYAFILVGGGAFAAMSTLRRHRVDPAAFMPPARERSAAIAAACDAEGALAWPAGVGEKVGTERFTRPAILWCTQPPGTNAQDVADRLVDRLRAEGGCLSVRADDDPGLAPLLRRVRTHRLLMTRYVATEAGERDLPAPELEAALKQALAGMPDVDEEVLHAYAVAFGQHNPNRSRDATRFFDSLGPRRLGGCHDPLSVYLPKVKDNEASFVLHAQRGPALDALGAWLCAHGCQVAVTPAKR